MSYAFRAKIINTQLIYTCKNHSIPEFVIKQDKYPENFGEV